GSLKPDALKLTPEQIKEVEKAFQDQSKEKLKLTPEQEKETGDFLRKIQEAKGQDIGFKPLPEMVDEALKQSPKLMELLKSGFSLVDKDGDGVISPKDISAITSKFAPLAATADGKVDLKDLE